MRGRTDRTQKTNEIDKKKKTSKFPKKNIMEVKIEKNRIFEYSAKNKRVNPEEPNSVLKPLTNSLSPSEKSKGVRLSSARKEGTQAQKKGTKTMKLINKGRKKKP